MGFAFSKVVGPTASVAGTKTTVGSTFVIPPGNFHVHSMRVSKGNVVNAKEIVGTIEVECTGVDGTYQYVQGNGVGGATNSHAIDAEKIDCRIPAPGGGTMTVSITDAENATAAIVSLSFWTGSQRVDSYATGGAGKDPAAATLLEIGTITPTKSGRIKQIRYGCGNIVDAKSASGKLEILVPGLTGPFEFAVGTGVGGATLGGPGHADVIDIDIPVGKNTIITCNVTYTDATDSATISLAIA